jgi:fucose permease
MRYGQRGVAMIGPLCQLINYVVLVTHPPFPVLVVFIILEGIGSGLMNAAWNAYISNHRNANQLMGILHGCFGLGATISPFIATAMITKAHLPWYTFYYVMVAGVSIQLIWLLAAFWTATGAAYRAANPRTTASKGGRTKEALSRSVTWLVSLFLLGYVGVEVSLGGWIVTFMIRVRQGDAFSSGMSAVGFWLGLTVGRVILGFVTPRVGERLAIIIYLLLAMFLELLFWLLPSFVASTVAVACLGFVLGPLFPAAIVISTRLLPRHLHVSAIGFASAVGGGGAALVPFAVGAIAQAKGVQVLQPIILALLVVISGLWITLPAIRGENGGKGGWKRTWREWIGIKEREK